MPRVSSLNHPASGLSTLVAWPMLSAATARCDVPFIAFQQHHALRRGVVISRIQTQMLWRGAAWAWAHNRTVVEQLAQHRRVIDIGGGHKDTQGDSSAIDQNMVFYARFGAIRRVRAGLCPPRRRAHVGAGTALPVPCDCKLLIVERQTPGMDLLIDPSALPLGKAIINGLPRAELFGQRPPRTTSPQHIEEGIK